MFKKAFDYVKNTTAGKLILAGTVLTVGGVIAYCTTPREKDEESGEEKEETKPEEKKDYSGK